MTTCIIAFLIAIFAALGATQLVRRYALRIGAVDVPDNYRKRHHGVVPRLGGIAIFAAFLAALLGLYLVNPYVLNYILVDHRAEALGCILGGAAALLLGIVDDLRSLRPRTKLLLQLIPALIAFVTGCKIGAVSLPFFGYVELGWLSLPVSVLWFLSCMNAVNFLDGLDGLAAGVMLFVTLTLFLVGLLFENVFSMVLMACLSGAILGFLVYNFHPARIFLGDSGSMLLGFLVAALSLLASRKAETTVALLIPVVALGLPIMDTALAILRRWYKRLPFETADRQHIHHALIAMGWSHRRAVLILYSVCVTLGLSALLITIERSEVTVAVLGALTIMAAVCIRIFGRLKFADLFIRLADERDMRQRGTEATIAVEKAVDMLKETESPEQMWSVCEPVWSSLGLYHAGLHLEGRDVDEERELTWRAKASGADSFHDLWEGRMRLHRNGSLYGTLSVRKLVGDQPFLGDTPKLLERLHQAMAEQMERFNPATRNFATTSYHGEESLLASAR